MSFSFDTEVKGLLGYYISGESHKGIVSNLINLWSILIVRKYTLDFSPWI